MSEPRRKVREHMPTKLLYSLPFGIPYCGMHPSLSQAERVRLCGRNFSGTVVMGLILLVCKQMMLFQCEHSFSVFITLACPGFVCACLCKCASLRFGMLELQCAPPPPPGPLSRP